jgi:hypothetical protein
MLGPFELVNKCLGTQMALTLVCGELITLLVLPPFVAFLSTVIEPPEL